MSWTTRARARTAIEGGAGANPGWDDAPLSDAELYSKLTTYKPLKCADRVLVKPCAPDDSSFYRALAGTCEGVGGIALAQMPFGCLPQFDSCTPADKLEGIRQWIANGAPRP